MSFGSVCPNTFQVKLDVSYALKSLTVKEDDLAQSIMSFFQQSQDNEDHFSVLAKEHLVIKRFELFRDLKPHCIYNN